MKDSRHSEKQKDKAFLEDGNGPTFIIGNKEYASVDEMPPLLQKIFRSLESIPGISFPGSDNAIDISTISGEGVENSQSNDNGGHTTTPLPQSSQSQPSPGSVIGGTAEGGGSSPISHEPLHPESTNPLHTRRVGDYVRTTLVILGIIGLIIYFIFS